MTDFSAADLLYWYYNNKRDLPWRKTDDPYKIWVSEIMLQQTRVDTVIPYYHRFIEAFPNIETLANADLQKVLKLWEGLGYYSRGRNLHSGARYLLDHHDGKVPDNRDELLKVKGIGPYTAAAILSIAYGKRYAVVDGNVLRVLSRYFGIRDDIRSGAVIDEIQNLADTILPDEQPGDFNQAVMELGATVCKPSSPLCNYCPLSPGCSAWNQSLTSVIPYKSPRKKIPHHHIAVGLILNPDKELLISLRPEQGMLGGLWEFPGGKVEQHETLQEALHRELDEELGIKVHSGSEFVRLKHAYSHFKITLYAYWCKIEDGVPKAKSSQKISWVSVRELDEFPFPKANKMIIEALDRLDDRELEQIYSTL